MHDELLSLYYSVLLVMLSVFPFAFCFVAVLLESKSLPVSRFSQRNPTINIDTPALQNHPLASHISLTMSASMRVLSASRSALVGMRASSLPLSSLSSSLSSASSAAASSSMIPLMPPAAAPRAAFHVTAHRAGLFDSAEVKAQKTREKEKALMKEGWKRLSEVLLRDNFSLAAFEEVIRVRQEKKQEKQHAHTYIWRHTLWRLARMLVRSVAHRATRR